MTLFVKHLLMHAVSLTLMRPVISCRILSIAKTAFAGNTNRKCEHLLVYALRFDQSSADIDVREIPAVV